MGNRTKRATHIAMVACDLPLLPTATLNFSSRCCGGCMRGICLPLVSTLLIAMQRHTCSLPPPLSFTFPPPPPPPSITVLTYSNRGREYVGNRTLCITCLMSHGTGEYPLPAYGTKLCGCQGDGECAALGQHCCCYSAAKDDISCTQDPVTQPNQCCGDPSNDCKKSAKLGAAGAQRPQPPWSL